MRSQNLFDGVACFSSSKNSVHFSTGDEDLAGAAVGFAEAGVLSAAPVPADAFFCGGALAAGAVPAAVPPEGAADGCAEPPAAAAPGAGLYQGADLAQDCQLFL
ncbi:hypothetical protein ACWGPW_14095, partial [Paenibacillus chitinolyticus]